MNNYIVRVQSKNEEYFIELTFVTLLFYDTIHADIAKICGDFTAFQYEDEDGDKITVRSDADLEGFREALKNGIVNSIQLVAKQIKSKPNKTKDSFPVETEKNNLDVYEILPTDLEHLDIISSGQFGTVFRSLHLPSDQIVAVKCVEITDGRDEKTEVLSEIKLLKQCSSSEFIVSLKGASFDANVFLICLEFMDGGSVSNFVPIPSRILQQIALSTFEGLKFIWSLRIMHRDLKPENVLINSDGFVKLSDFGVSKKMDHSIARSFVGTSAYMAPERIRGGEYRLESDIWSFGLTVWELLLGKFPIDPGQNILGNYWQHFINVQRNFLSQGIEPSLADLIRNCVLPDVIQRWSLLQLQQSTFLNIPLDRELVAEFIRTKPK